MNASTLRTICLGLPGTTDTIQWHDDRVFKVGRKMFAVSGLDENSRYSFKVDDERFLELTDQAGIVPAPYLARARWVQVDPSACALSDHEIETLLRRSWELVFSKLTRKEQARILTEDDDARPE